MVESQRGGGFVRLVYEVKINDERYRIDVDAVTVWSSAGCYGLISIPATVMMPIPVLRLCQLGGENEKFRENASCLAVHEHVAVCSCVRAGKRPVVQRPPG
jgi:hypothetical protein